MKKAPINRITEMKNTQNKSEKRENPYQEGVCYICNQPCHPSLYIHEDCGFKTWSELKSIKESVNRISNHLHSLKGKHLSEAQENEGSTPPVDIQGGILSDKSSFHLSLPDTNKSKIDDSGGSIQARDPSSKEDAW